MLAILNFMCREEISFTSHLINIYKTIFSVDYLDFRYFVQSCHCNHIILQNGTMKKQDYLLRNVNRMYVRVVNVFKDTFRRDKFKFFFEWTFPSISMIYQQYEMT